MNIHLTIFSGTIVAFLIGMYRYRHFLRTNKKVRFVFKEFILPVFIFVYFVPGMIVRVTYVPSGSMTPTIIKGDKILLSKVHFGARTPSSILQLPFFEKKYYKKIQVPSFRLPALSPLKTGDCVVFNYPGDIIHDNFDMGQWFVKRVIAMPGDKISIKQGKVYINGKPFKLPKYVELQSRYLVTLQGFRYSSKESQYLTKFLNIDEIYQTDLDHTYMVHLTKKQAKRLEQEKEVTQVKQYYLPLPTQKEPMRYFTYGKNFAECLGGNGDNLPEITTPAKGMSITITRENLCIYGHVILHHEGLEDVKIDAEAGTLTIKGTQVDTYTFTRDHFFPMGDNRPGSADGRSWGFVPLNNVVGKPIGIVCSNKNDYLLIDLLTLQMHWDRFFKRIR